jgi:DNA polymerase III alpha subunit
LLIKECGKIIAEKPEQEMTMISSLIPKTYGQVKDISEAYQEVEQFKEWCDQNKEAYQIALKLRDLIKNKGVHPSGVLLSYYDLETICPTEFSSDKEVVSSFDMNWASVFNIKLDILGLRSVSVVDNVCKSINIKIEDIDLNNYILFIGCSHTEGIGLELQTTYPYLVSEELKCDYYNLGLGGTGIDV